MAKWLGLKHDHFPFWGHSNCFTKVRPCPLSLGISACSSRPRPNEKLTLQWWTSFHLETGIFSTRKTVHLPFFYMICTQMFIRLFYSTPPAKLKGQITFKGFPWESPRDPHDKVGALKKWVWKCNVQYTSQKDGSNIQGGPLQYPVISRVITPLIALHVSVSMFVFWLKSLVVTLLPVLKVKAKRLSTHW